MKINGILKNKYVLEFLNHLPLPFTQLLAPQP